MYGTVRRLRAKAARLSDAIAMATYITGLINERHGGALRVSVEVGGDPHAIAIGGRWESMGAFQTARESMMADAEIEAAGRMGADTIIDGSIEDVLLKIDVPLGEPKTFATVSQARVELARVDEAMALAVAVTETVKNVTGNQTGVAHALTGDRSRLMWIGFADSLDEIGQNNDKLEADAGYLENFRKSDGLFVPSSLTGAIWHNISG